MTNKENRLSYEKFGKEVSRMSIFKQLKENALNNMKNRPFSFAIGIIAVICGTVGLICFYLVCA